MLLQAVAGVVADSVVTNPGGTSYVIGIAYKAIMALIAIFGFTTILIKLSKIAKDVADIFTAVSKALEDGKISSDEAESIKKEVKDVIDDVENFKKK